MGDPSIAKSIARKIAGRRTENLCGNRQEMLKVEPWLPILKEIEQAFPNQQP
jgi:hypothetical protein